MSILAWIKAHWSILFLCFVVALICSTNFTPHTWLIGWDNIMPEFNIGLNLKRSLFAVWQEYQGLGLVGGMAHATDLIREIIVFPFTLFVPAHLIRYGWHFFLLFLGALGLYKLLRSEFKFSNALALSGSLFYLLNFGTIQYFWATLESFSAFWGFFPWLMLALFQVLQSPTRRHFLFFTLINLLAIPAFYVQTIFIVYMLCVVLVLFSHFIFSARNSSLKIRHYFKLFLIILILNSFWLLPLSYFVTHDLKNPTLGMGNIESSEASFMRNVNRGTLPDFLLLRNYYFDFSNNGQPFMASWDTHFANTYILIAGYLLSTLVIIGFIRLLITKKNPLYLSLLLFFLLVSIALLSATPPFSLVNDLLRKNSLLNQIFRAPFTKFVVPAAFTFSCLVPFGLKTLTDLVTALKYKMHHLQRYTSLAFIILLFIYSFPVFQGNFIYPQLRQNIPPEYSQLFAYLNSQPSTARIANLPQGSFWGWTNYNYNVTGSGFLWYAIPQPILDRAFDAWNLNNEQYYWQLTYALQSQNPQLLSVILSQYNIEYVLFDNHVVYLDEKVYAKLSLATKELLPQVPGLTLEKSFGKQIQLYRFHQPTQPYLVTNLPNIDNPNYYHQDTAFSNFGDYRTQIPTTYALPYANSFTARPQNEINPLISHPTDQPLVALPITSYLNPQLTPSGSIQSDQSNQFIRLTATKNHSLLPINFPQLTYNQSYLIKLTYRHLSGYPLLVSIASNDLKHLYTNILLDKYTNWKDAWFVIPPETTDNSASGITILLDNTSFDQQASINDIKDIKVYPYAYTKLTNYVTPSVPVSATPRQYLPSQSLIFIYKISLDTKEYSSNAKYLILPQSYEPGWLAFYLDGLTPHFLTNHQKVDNWANGWSLPTTNPAVIYCLFWPQILEFIGLIILPVPFLWLRKRNP